MLFFLKKVFLNYRLVNENEVKQWREQAEKFRKGRSQRTLQVKMKKENTVNVFITFPMSRPCGAAS